MSERTGETRPTARGVGAMAEGGPLPLSNIEEEVALRKILEGTATETGERFFAALVRSLAEALGTHGAWVTVYLEEARRLRALAFWVGGKWIEHYECDIAGTPCEPVILEGRLAHFPDRVITLFPSAPDLRAMGAVSYMGVPLLDTDGRVLGHLAVLDTRPMPAEPRALAIFRIFAARAAAELRRLRADSDVREREAQLGRLLGGAMDAIVELDRDLRVTLMNPAAEEAFGCRPGEALGSGFARFLGEDGRATLEKLRAELDGRPEGPRSLFIPGGLRAVRAGGGGEFPAEATLSRYEVRRRIFYALILRNVETRLEAERKVRALAHEAEALREEIRALRGPEEIIGRSEALGRVLDDVAKVAPTDATVLVLGETGTGKELVARAVHAMSRRRDRALVKINCGAIPAGLIESEFFGHEKGAFTGAAARRDGRFALADGGTIFLDEVAELPLELQPKLLRVLQEGEFEPVGGSRTRKVDVRVVAATNRDLAARVREGAFREDLYYRLNVFPVELPPLRQRGEDVLVLASAFAERAARRLGRPVRPLSDDDARRLKAYSWPGNIRELENVIERALITSTDGRLNLDRALPETAAGRRPLADGPRAPAPDGSGPAPPVRTAADLEAIERENTVRALEAASWRVAGERGAARLLGMKPSTLVSRMRSLGIERPRSR